MGGSIGRHHGLDWLRIFAFAILILYHTAMYVGPLHWVVKSAQPSAWLAYPLNAISPWRLMILFAVSGYASAVMLHKFGQPGAFLRERSKRLLLPLLSGVIILVPPQSWVRLVTENEYQRSFATFWLHDDFRFGNVLGHTLPHWEHLWFLGYLWAYTVLLVGLVLLLPDWRNKASQVATWFAKGTRLLLVPLVFIIPLRLLLVKEGLADHGMFDDFIGDAHYIPAFLFGFLLAGNADLWTALARLWKLALGLSLFACAFLMAATATDLAGLEIPTPLLVMSNIADTVMAWAMLPVAFHVADRWLNRDNRWRATLAEAVFPAYLVHQTVIVLLGWYLLRFDLPNAAAFLIIATAVITSSALAYWLAKRIGWLGLFLGVAPRAAVTPV